MCCAGSEPSKILRLGLETEVNTADYNGNLSVLNNYIEKRVARIAGIIFQ